MASNSNESTPDKDFAGYTVAESKIIHHMCAQFGRDLSPDEAMDLHERAAKIPKISF